MSHSAYLDAGLAGGFPGMALFGWLVLTPILKLWRRKFEPPIGWLLAVYVVSIISIGGTSAMQLKHLIADGRVVIIRAGGTLLADQVDYDPITHWMIARGSENRPAHYEDPDPKKSMTAVQMEWNTQTWNVKLSDPKVSHPK